jgi:hypothetical protein
VPRARWIGAPGAPPEAGAASRARYGHLVHTWNSARYEGVRAAMFARIALLALLGATLLGCSPAAISSLLPASTLPLVTVTTRGGECPEGACGSTLVIERDGRLRQTAPEDVVLGQVAPEVLAALDGAIKTADFAAIRARPFTGECPVTFDGQETIYEFGAPRGVERIASCETEIDPNHPLFKAVDTALAAGGAV